jgi:hypothetical protein
MRFLHVGNAVPDDFPSSMVLALELCNEVCLMGQQHACTTVVFVIGPTVNGQVSAARDIYSLVDETDFPKRVMGKSRLKASWALSPATSWATSALIVSATAAVSTVAAAVDNAVAAAKISRIRLDFQLAERFIECLSRSQSMPFGRASGQGNLAFSRSPLGTGRALDGGFAPSG